ncbi:protein ZGRF1 [Perognathus longimembris pacificus]|uniref:protein ZGRF1 n=1 Tax=Perognathus longimembris pacificus TaxID=214514 RepID=UPI002019AFBE|nr:protein ZGRF1 [Perognathus longimembris pacificus]
MEKKEFIVLYTHQKTKKSKVWQDGILKLTHVGNKATLYDDKGTCLESLFLKCFEVKPGDDLESDRYLITVEEVKTAGSRVVKQDVIETPESNSRKVVSSGRSLGCQPAGLKRNFAGYQRPHQVPKKVVVTENATSSETLETEKPYFPFFPPFSSTPPLFSTVGKRVINNMPTVPENIFTSKNIERNTMPCSSVVSSSSFNSDPQLLSEENYFCSSINSKSRHSDSLLNSEPISANSLVPHYEVSQTIRSKAQILALLKSNSNHKYKDLNFEITGNFSQVEPQGSSEKIPSTSKYLHQQEEYAQTKGTENLHEERPSENTTKTKSRWSIYLSSQSCPVDENDREGNPESQEDDINLKNFWAQKNIQTFEACPQNGNNHNQFWNLEEKLESPFCESSSLLVSCNSAENNGLLLASDTQKNSKISLNDNNRVCIEDPVCIREKVVSTCGPLEQDDKPGSPLPKSEYLQGEPSLQNKSSLSDGTAGMSSECHTGNESPSTVCEPSQPSIEVTFNLSNFEISDTDEESLYESNRHSQDSEHEEKEILVNDGQSYVQKGCEDINCQEIGSEHLPFLTAAGGKPKEILPRKELLLSEFCDRICVGFDTGPCKDGNTGKATEEQDGDTLSNFDLSLEWNDVDAHVDSNRGAAKPTQKVRINYDCASPLNKGLNRGLHILHFSDTATNQIPKNKDVFSEDAHSQPSSLESDLDKNEVEVLTPICDTDDSIQLLNTSQDHSEYIAFDKSKTQSFSSFFCPQRKNHPISEEAEAYIPETGDLERIRSSTQDYVAVETSRKSTHTWSNSRDCSELPGVVNDFSLLKSLSEHSTALESVEIFQKKDAAFKQQGIEQTYEPDSFPEARKVFTTVVSQAIPVSPQLKQNSQQFFPLETEEDTAFQAAIPQEIEGKICDPKPVVFQGHQVKGSATSGEMVRGHSSQLVGRSHFSGTMDYEDFMKDMSFLAPDLPNPYMQAEFLEVISPEQKISTLNPVSTFPLNSRDEDVVTEFSEESLKARTLPGMKNFSSLQTENLQRPPLLTRGQMPFATLPPAYRPDDLEDSCSFFIGREARESSSSPMLNLYNKSEVLPFSFQPEDQSETSSAEESREMTPGDVPMLDTKSTQSKWLKYQNTPQCHLTALNRVKRKVTDEFFAETVSGMHFSDLSERQRRSDSMNESSVDSVHLQMIKGMLYQHQDLSSQNLVSRKKALSSNLKQTSKEEEIQNVLGRSACFNSNVNDLQEINGSELCFPSGQKITSAFLPQRQIHIPAVFQSPIHYKQIFTSSIIEHLNILLLGLSQRLHKVLSKVDISFYTSSKAENLENVETNLPSCHHNQPAKLVMVKKEGPNKGRFFYACDRPKADQCKFFKWLEEVTPGWVTQEESQPSMVLNDIKSIGMYLRSQKIPVYEDCQLFVRKGFDFQRKQYGKLKKFATINPEFHSETKSKLYLKLSRKESSSVYSKDDLWVVSKTLDFELDTFIACSAFFGPSSTNEVELLPLKGYFPSNWPTNIMVHALLVCNASTELTTLKNIQNYFNPATLPLTPYLLNMSSSTTVSSRKVSKRNFIPPAFVNIHTKAELLSLGATLQLANEFIQTHKLNKDQATALIQIAQMMSSLESVGEVKELCIHTLPITVIHGVFGAGKSYLLSVVILFFVHLFEKSEALTAGNARPWKLLISSSTNVAVDRVLLGLLGLGFEKFVRVGSLRKIAKPILPHSLHAGSENENEQLKELHALMKEDLTPVERVYVRKSIEQHKLGTNRTLLKQVRVVGVTCAACPFPCMNDLKFPVVVLDECSQITEPASLLPIARFECEKLILVGDPKQLPPTIQGSDAAHENGLEQTLFDRLCLMGHKPVMLRTQYRCHPAISAIANDLFYGGNLMNGISEPERSPLLAWLPTLCFYNVPGLEQIERDNSFYNVAEAAFTLKLIQSLIASGIAGHMIGVITLYKSQMYKLCHLLTTANFDSPDIKSVQVSTVDAFQGAEKEIIILSCVRTRQVGFIDSEKRVNVALTRGRRHLLIVGNLACLRKNRLWGRVIQHCEGRKDGLQHASQCEPQLNHVLKDYFEKQAEEKQKKKNMKEKCKEKLHPQKDMV